MKHSGSYKRKRWNILFIGEHGKVVPIKYFKGIVSLLTLLFVGLAVVVVVLTYVNRHQTERVRALTHDLEKQQDENIILKKDKDRVLARVVILESDLKALRGTEAVAGSADALPAGNPQKQSINDARAAGTPPADTVAPKKKKTSQESNTEDTVDAPANPASIIAENLVVCQDQESEFMRVEFKVMNIGPKGVPVSGRAVIVLKKDDMDPAEWIVLPNVPLLDRKPEGSRGRLFRIYNFRTLKFKVKSPTTPDQFKYASIYTYTEEGEMLLERDYPLDMTDMCP